MLCVRAPMVSFRLRPSTAAILDRQRGNMSRTAYLEALIKTQEKDPRPIQSKAM
jgi:hypothetical protein